LSDLPSKVYVTHVSCKKREIPLIVEEWVEREGRNRGWYWYGKLGDGYLIEVHLDGDGRSYLSSMIDKGRSDGIVPSVNNDLVVEVGQASLHTLVIEHDEAYIAKPDYLHSSQKMNQLVLDPSPYLLTSSLICFLISISAMLVAISARPPLEPIVIPDVPTQKTPTQWWDENAHWGRTEQPVSLSLEQNGGWVLETKEVKHVR